MSRNLRSNENGRYDESSSNRKNVHVFDNFGEFQLNLSKRNQLGGIDDFEEIQSNSSKQNQLCGFDDFIEFLSFSVLHAFLDISRSQGFYNKGTKDTGNDISSLCDSRMSAGCFSSKKKPSSTGSKSVTQAKFLSAFSKEFARLRKQTIHTGSFNEGQSLCSETRWRFTFKCCILKRRLHLLT